MSPIDSSKFEAKCPSQNPYSHGYRCHNYKTIALDLTRLWATRALRNCSSKNAIQVCNNCRIRASTDASIMGGIAEMSRNIQISYQQRVLVDLAQSLSSCSGVSVQLVVRCQKRFASLVICLCSYLLLVCLLRSFDRRLDSTLFDPRIAALVSNTRPTAQTPIL